MSSETSTIMLTIQSMLAGGIRGNFAHCTYSYKQKNKQTDTATKANNETVLKFRDETFQQTTIALVSCKPTNYQINTNCGVAPKIIGYPTASHSSPAHTTVTKDQQISSHWHTGSERMQSINQNLSFHVAGCESNYGMFTVGRQRFNGWRLLLHTHTVEVDRQPMLQWMEIATHTHS